MRNLSASENNSMAEATALIGDRGFADALKRAEGAAKKQMLKMNKNIVNGRSCEDFAVEAYLYITSKGQSLNFLPRRAKLLVIDHHRYESGRKTRKNRARHIGSISEIATRFAKQDASKLEIPSNMTSVLKCVCEGLMCGHSKKNIVYRMGIHPTVLSKMIHNNKRLIEAMFI